MDLPGKGDKPSGAVAVLTTRTVRPGLEEKFEAELHEFIADSLHEEGQLGVHVIRPVPGSGSREYGILRRFSDPASRDRFYASEMFGKWDKAVAALTVGEPVRQELTGLETWFTLPGQRSIIPPPRWKMAVVTVTAVWPVSLLVSWLLNPLTGGMPMALQALFTAIGIVIILTWVAMPLLVKILAPWLNAVSTEERRSWRL